MAKRKAMGRDPLGWIGESDEVAVASEEEAPVSAVKPEVGERGTEEGPKFLSYEVMTARLRSDQVDMLSALERQIMRGRRRKGERITKNSLLRAAVDVLATLQFDVRGIGSEEELRERVLAARRAEP
jgi:hypothetical protein